MRTWFLVLALLAAAGLTACKREPTFDERYAGARKAIRDKAGELDKDLAKRSGQPHAETIKPDAIERAN